MHTWQDDSVLPNPSIVSDDGGTLERKIFFISLPSSVKDG